MWRSINSGGLLFFVAQTGAFGVSGRLDVLPDLGNTAAVPSLSRKRSLVAKALPELDDEPRAVEVAGEVEQVRLDTALVAAVVGVRADRDRGAVLSAAPA